MNPGYKVEVATSVAGARGTLAAKIKLAGNQPSGIWLDHTGTISSAAPTTTAGAA
jgi:hypothetical protein